MSKCTRCGQPFLPGETINYAPGETNEMECEHAVPGDCIEALRKELERQEERIRSLEEKEDRASGEY